MAYGPYGINYIREPNAVERVRDMLYNMAAERRPSIAALKRTGASWHPSKVG